MPCAWDSFSIKNLSKRLELLAILSGPKAVLDRNGMNYVWLDNGKITLVSIFRNNTIFETKVRKLVNVFMRRIDSFSGHLTTCSYT